MTAISLPVLGSTGADATGCASAPVVSAPVVQGKPLQQSQKETTVGNYFVANYPPFGFWKPEFVERFRGALREPPRADTRMGVYAHIPFCRKRCHFCYFRVYTDKNSSDIRAYLDAMIHELGQYARSEAVRGRVPRFVYFGGGTPSYLSPDQFAYLSGEMRKLIPWEGAEEITLEAEPGTLNEKKMRAIRDMGVTRLSLGIEHFDDHVLEINGRAHRSKETLRAYDWARAAGFPEINVDLIAGMVEETEEKWAETVEKTLALAPDTLTIYQMEVPYNTTIYKRMQAEGSLVAPVADWETKRRWLNQAFERFVQAGYTVTSGSTVVKDPRKNKFIYRQCLFNGTDVVSVGVSAFGHISGVNYQNEHDFQPYIDAVGARGMPTYRAYPLSREENYIREFALQLKGGIVDCEPFARKFGVDPRQQFAGALGDLSQRGLLRVADHAVEVTRAGLLQIDRLLFDFFRPEHRVGRFA
ncbi:MAG: coproporphyrinogen-III oxidase family protein [Planctomycetota bacterium]|nr:coproporphyrinogen-III oxidase family protein [Planctomycetota bacterium]